MKATNGQEIPTPFPRITYEDSMDKYGCDRPDRRIPWILTTVTDPRTSRRK